MILLFALALPPARATSDFDPSAAEASFTGEETYTIDGESRLWGEIERLHDADRTLFHQEAFNSVTAWAEGSKYAPWIAECFGDSEPASGYALLHVGIHEASSSGTPILFVPGAGDNGSRGFIAMATHMDELGRPVFALTFAHPHGDVFLQAEMVADAIARIKARTGAEQVDLVSHSKGGLASAVYLSNSEDADWGDDAYAEVGTRYRGDVRKAVFIATPLGGIDSGFRWTDMNLASLSPDTALSPASWSAWYPYTTADVWVSEDLSDQDFWSDGEDLFPGQRQLLARQDDYPLPWTLPVLGTYAYQIDNLSTYEGGWGSYSYAPGIDAAIEDGGDLIARLEETGVDPDVRLYLLAGENPLMPNGVEDVLAETFGQVWVDMATAGTDAWAALLADLVGDGLVSVGVSSSEVQGLASGKVILGEVTGPSDGLVFVSSATKSSALTARGAVVEDSYVANLSHLDLLYASPVTAALMQAEADDDPLEDGWEAGFAERYAEADTIGWVEEVLADPSSGGEGEGEGEGEAGEGEGEGEGEGDVLPGGDDTGSAVIKPGCACGTSPGRGAGGAVLLALLGLRRRRR